MNNREGSTGPVIATVIILVIVVLGGLYFWGQRTGSDTDLYGNPVKSSSTGETASADSMSASDDTSSIEADLKATDVDSLGAEINAS